MGKLTKLKNLSSLNKPFGLAFWTIICVIIGSILGFNLRPLNIGQGWKDLISYPGELFARALQLIALPLIISSFIAGSANIKATLNRRVAVRALVYFLLTSVINATLGVLLAAVVFPPKDLTSGEMGSNLTAVKGRTMLDNFLDIGRNIVPANIFESLFQETTTIYDISGDDPDNYIRKIGMRRGTNAIGIITFCLTFGAILGSMGNASKGILDACQIISEIMMKITSRLVKVSPLGLASIIAGKVIEVDDLGVIVNQLGLYVLTVTLGLLGYQLIIQQLIYFLIIRRNPFKFYLGMTQAMITAFICSSSRATLPVTIKCVLDLKVSENLAKILLTIGATINKDAKAFFVSFACVYVLHSAGIALGIGDFANIIITGLAVSIAGPSIPSIILLVSGYGVPATDVTILFVTEWFLDRVRTVGNVLADGYSVAVVEHFSKEDIKRLDQEAADELNRIQDEIHKDI